MIKMFRYVSRDGCAQSVQSEELSWFAALATLTAFLATDRMTACLNPQVRISRIVDARGVLFWRDGEGDGEYCHFEGGAKNIADLTAMFRLRNDNEELREALRQRLCSEVLPGPLWQGTHASSMGGASYRQIVLLYLSGISDPIEYIRVADAEYDVWWLVKALEKREQVRSAGGKYSLADVLQPVANAA